MSKIQLIKDDVDEHGEVHAVVEEAGAGEHFEEDGDELEELEIRQGTASFDLESGVITLTNGRTELRLEADSVVRWYKPMEFGH